MNTSVIQTRSGLEPEPESPKARREQKKDTQSSTSLHCWSPASERSAPVRAREEKVPDDGRQSGVHCCASRISTTSESVCPRTRASCFPSKDQWKSKIRSDVKLVICLPFDPSSGCDQRLSTPPSRTG